MEFELTAQMYTRLSGLAERRGWTVEELIVAYVGVAADVDEAGEAALLSDDERAVLITGLMTLGGSEAWAMIERFEERTLLCVRQSE